MTPTIRILALLAALAIPSAVMAQDQAAGTGGATDAGTGAGLSMGATDGEPAVGQTYVAGAFGDWELRCLKTETGAEPCQLFQGLSDETGRAVAEFSLFALPEGQEAVAGAEVITPLETLLTPGLRLSVDGGQGRRYPFSYCAQYAAERYGCFARLGFKADEIDQFKRGQAGSVEIVPAAAADQVVSLKLSLTGFTAAWDAMQAAARPK